MKTRVYPTSRKLFGLFGDVTIIILTYILLTYLIIPLGIREAHQALYCKRIINRCIEKTMDL